MNRSLAPLLLAVFVLGAVIPAHAQEGTSADSLFAAGKYRESAEAYRSLTESEPANPALWFRLGYSYHMSEQLAKAALAYEEAIELGRHPAAMYNMACVKARQGMNGESLSWLDSAVTNGFANIDLLETDEELNSIRTEPRFSELKETAERNAMPCRYDERYRQLDFWLGQWEVYTPQGNRAGTNHLARVAGDCAISETWNGTFMNGISYTTFDQQSETWRQTWIDDKGDLLLFEGGISDGAMVLIADDVGPGGKPILRRMTVRPIGDFVEQKGEISFDEGKTWSTSYLLEYRPAGS